MLMGLQGIGDEKEGFSEGFRVGLPGDYIFPVRPILFGDKERRKEAL
jgi:hypothetical protein